MKKIIVLLVFPIMISVMMCGCDVDDLEEYKENGAKYNLGGAEISESVSDIDIDWSSGKVNIEYYDGDNIKFEEESAKELKDKSKLSWSVVGNTLDIKYKKPEISIFSFSESKQLKLYLPRDYALNELDVSVSSADILTDALIADSIDFESSSGNIDLNVSDAREVSAESSSGSVKINGDIKDLDIESSSGDVDVTALETLNDCEIETSSGKVNLKLPESLGFRLEIDTSSGEFNSDFAYVQSKNIYTHESGKSYISIETSSGDINVNKLK